MKILFFLLICVFCFFGCVVTNPELSNEIQKCKELEEHQIASDGRGAWNIFPQTYCIAELAIENDDLLICDELADVETEYEGASGYSYKNVSWNPRRECYERVLRKTLNVDVCDQAKDEERRQECRYRVIFELREPGLCLKNQDDETANRCISHSALKLHQSSICSLAKGQEAQEACRNQFKVE